MFTGLVEAIGVLRKREGRPVARATIMCALGPLSLGESVNVNGVCLTVDRILDGAFEADLSSETRDKTTLDAVPIGGRVHLERATPLGGRMGGHVVLGHVDAVGSVVDRETAGDAVRLAVEAPPKLSRFIAEKGSIAIDGVSLTVNHVSRGGGPVVVRRHARAPHALRRRCSASSARVAA